VRALAQKTITALWSANACHPFLHFKSIAKSDWSVRVVGHYRAVGKFSSGNGWLARRIQQPVLILMILPKTGKSKTGLSFCATGRFAF